MTDEGVGGKDDGGSSPRKEVWDFNLLAAALAPLIPFNLQFTLPPEAVVEYQGLRQSGKT